VRKVQRKVFRAFKEMMVLLLLRAQLVRKAQQDHKAFKVHKVFRVFKAHKVLAELVARKAALVHRAFKV
jgi:hypothetical protein